MKREIINNRFLGICQKCGNKVRVRLSEEATLAFRVKELKKIVGIYATNECCPAPNRCKGGYKIKH